MITNNSTPILVAIRCLTYNHEPYIRQCLEGFVMQKTNFRFVAIVHDDVSTDGTSSIIREYEEKYPDIIKPIYETENQYSKRDGSLTRIMNEAINATGCKYIAMCEGDDYWIDPLKLQKQVDFLETNPDYTLSHSAFDFYFEEEKRFVSYVNQNTHIPKEEVIRLIINNNTYRIQTNTAVFRIGDYYDVINSDVFLYQSGYFMMGDTQLWVGLLQKGNIHYLDEITSVYRVHTDSACRQLSLKANARFQFSCNEMRVYLINKFNLKNNNWWKKRYFITLLIYLSVDPSFTLNKYNPYPFYYYFIKLITTIPFVRNRILRHIGK